MRGLGGFALGILVVLLLRSTALSPLAARGVVVDVLAAATVFWALRHGASWGASFGFFLGLAADLDAAYWPGRHALALSILGYGVGRLAGTLVRESARTQLVLVAIAVVAHQAWTVAFELGGLEGIGAGWPYLVRRAAIAALVTAPVVTLVLSVVHRVSGRPLFGHASVHPG